MTKLPRSWSWLSVGALAASLPLAACASSSQTSAAAAPQTAPPASAAIAASDPGLDVALAGAQRSEANRARDVYRHPKETLAFFGITPSQHVIELWPGGGWYTEVLGPWLRDKGSLSVVVPTGKYLQPYRDTLNAHPELYDQVHITEVTPPDSLVVGPPSSADTILTFRNIHNWLMGDFAQALHKQIFAALKPGGVYGVVEHRAAPGTTIDQSKKSGYVTEDVVIQLATEAGFVLEARSEINANPNDTKDYPEGVWSLPPSYRQGDTDHAKYQAIGESDRMTLRFRKPL